MHWWIRPRGPVQSGMFCCGRSKGEKDSHKQEDSSRTPPTPRPKRAQSEGNTCSSRLLGDKKQETDVDAATQQEQESRLLLSENAEVSTILDQLSLVANNACPTIEAVHGDLIPSDHRNQENSTFHEPTSSIHPEGEIDLIPDACGHKESFLTSTKQNASPAHSNRQKNELTNERSNSSDERRLKEIVPRSAEHDLVLKELSQHPRLQSSEQRIQLHHDVSQEPRLHLTPQHQLQFQINQQQQKQILQQQQHQQDHQQFKLRQQQNLPESVSVPSTLQQNQQSPYSNSSQNQQLPHYQLFHKQQQQQKKHLYQQHLQQSLQQQQQHILQHSRSHDIPGAPTNAGDRPTFQHQLSAYEGSRTPRPGHTDYSAHTGPTSSASLIPNSVSSHFYANVPASNESNALGPVGLEMGIKSMEVEDESFVVETVEIIKRPGQTLGFYIREGNGFDRSDGVFISRIQMGTVAQSNGLLHVGDEIVTVNNVKVGSMSLDDVVILMSIPKKLVLTIRTRRNSSKNKSCPVLPVAENPDPPIVVFKKGRSSSASALEMTEKCPDMYEPGQSFSQYPFQSADYMPRRELGQDKQAQSSSRYASIFISPQLAEARLVTEDGVGSSNSSDGSLPRSIDSSKERPYLGQEIGDSSQAGHISVTNPIYDQFSSIDYKHHLLPESIGRKTAMPKSPSKQNPLVAASQMLGYRIRPGADSSPSYSEPSYINIGALREGLIQQQQQQQHYQHHQPSPSLYPHAHHQQQMSSIPHHYQYQPPHQHQVYPIHTSAQGTSYPLSSQSYRGGVALSQEERRRQEKLRTLLSSKAKYSRFLRSRSPESYNSDSELVFTHQQPNEGRGFASDYETYGGTFSDDEPVYSIPRIPSSSSSELEILLKKFTTLSQELHQEQSKLQRQLSNRDKTNRAGHLPLSRAESLSGDEYGCQPLSCQGSPAPIRRAASTQTPVLQHRLIRHSSADTSSFTYGASYHHDSHTDLSGRSLPSSGALGAGANMSVAGGLPLSTSQTTMQLTKQAESSSLSPRAMSSKLRYLNLTRKPLHIPYSEFEPYKADMKKRGELTRTGGLDGLLSVHIMSGQGLKSSKTSLRDLYSVVAVDSLNKARTMIRTGAINFDWDEAFDIDLEDAKEASFLIYHWDQNYKHRLCFHGSILLPGYVHSGHKRYVAIKLEPKGILFVTLMYKDPALSLQRLPSIRKSALFGVDLETVILRENSGLNVPLLVHKCVLEVERRGLDTAGIYRLCGSSRRKIILREVFESSTQTVDLSPENVSDIHVITGVLKDYLRELPEPLFTNALYQMLLDALSVRLPCDPEGSAKLMLSILECLPSANQDTMALLLNHLRRVASHSDKNKMPVDSLAVCFGPVLLSPTPSSKPGFTPDFRKLSELLRYLLEIWDYDGSTGTTVSRSPIADTGEKGDSPQAMQPAQPPPPHLGSRRNSRDENTRFSADDTAGALGTMPKH